MKKLFVLSVLSAAFVVSCKSKTTASNSTSTKETANNGVKKELTAVEYAKGKELFESSCAKCHDLPKPTKY